MVRCLSAAYRDGEGDVGRRLFKAALETNLGFDARQAELYSSTVLSRNSNGSASFVARHAYRLAGRWMRCEDRGSAGNLVVMKTETWRFEEDLTYEHKLESYEGSVSPFGSSYSLPTSSSEYGVWAPSDQPEDTFTVVIISRAGHCRRLAVEWLDSRSLPQACKINRRQFMRE